MRINQVKIELLEQPGRTQRGLISHDADALDGEREKYVGVADYIMVEEDVLQVAACDLALCKCVSAAVIGHQAEQRVVALGETIETGLGIVLAFDHANGDLSAHVTGSTIVNGGGHIQRATLESGTIEVIKGRDSEDHSRAERMQPGKIA